MFEANKYFNDQEPWKKKDDLKRLNTILYVSLELIRKISIMLYPIIPSTSLKVLKIFNINEDKIDFNTIKDHENLNVKQQTLIQTLQKENRKIVQHYQGNDSLWIHFR